MGLADQVDSRRCTRSADRFGRGHAYLHARSTQRRHPARDSLGGTRVEANYRHVRARIVVLAVRAGIGSRCSKSNYEACVSEKSCQACRPSCNQTKQ